MRVAPYLLSMVLTALLVVMLVNWRRTNAMLFEARDEVERYRKEADRAVGRADSIAVAMEGRRSQIAALQHQLDSMERTRTPMPIFVRDAERRLDSGGLDSIRAVLLRRPG